MEGGLPLNKDGDVPRKFWKEPQSPVMWAWLEIFYTPKQYQFLKNTLPDIDLIFLAQYPEHPMRYQNQFFLTTKRYDEHPCASCMYIGVSTPLLHGTLAKIEKRGTVGICWYAENLFSCQTNTMHLVKLLAIYLSCPLIWQAIFKLPNSQDLVKHTWTFLFEQDYTALLHTCTYLRKLYCNWANSNWRWPQTVVGASSELSTAVEGSNGTSWLFDAWSGVTAIEKGSSSALLSSLLWLLSLRESFVFVTLCDVGKPFTAKDLKEQKRRWILE